jgi:hypothetical protein
LPAAVEIQVRIGTIVHRVQLRRAVEGDGNAVVVHVVGELLVVEHVTLIVLLLHLHQTIAIVPGVIRHIPCSNVRLRGHVAVGVIRPTGAVVRAVKRARCTQRFKLGDAPRQGPTAGTGTFFHTVNLSIERTLRCAFPATGALNKYALAHGFSICLIKFKIFSLMDISS